jgi:hypothetical protein
VRVADDAAAMWSGIHLAHRAYETSAPRSKTTITLFIGPRFAGPLGTTVGTIPPWVW